MCVCMCVYMYVCICVCVYVYVFILCTCAWLTSRGQLKGVSSLPPTMCDPGVQLSEFASRCPHPPHPSVLQTELFPLLLLPERSL